MLNSRLAAASELVVVMLLCSFGPARITAAVSVLLLLVIAFLSVAVRSETWRGVGLRQPQSWRQTFTRAFAGTLAMFGLAAAIVPVARLVTGGAPDLSLFDNVHGNEVLLAVWLVNVWIFAAFLEELIFRGYLLNRAADLFGRSRAGWAAAIVLSSVAFSLAHRYQGWAGVITSGSAGMLLGTLYLLNRRNLWSNVLCHGFVDTLFLFAAYARGTAWMQNG